MSRHHQGKANGEELSQARQVERVTIVSNSVTPLTPPSRRRWVYGSWMNAPDGGFQLAVLCEALSRALLRVERFLPAAGAPGVPQTGRWRKRDEGAGHVGFQG